MELTVASITNILGGVSIEFTGMRSDGHTFKVILETSDPKDIDRFPIGSKCSMTIDRKIGAPILGR
jgi:hypothetical protein